MAEAARAALDAMKTSELRRTAIDAGASEQDLENADDSDNPRRTFIDIIMSLQADTSALQAMKNSELRKMAIDLGANEKDLAAADDADNPKRTLIEIIMKLQKPVDIVMKPAPSTATPSAAAPSFAAASGGGAAGSCSETSIEFPAHLPSSAAMSTAARSVGTLPEGSQREDAASTLFKLIDSVLASPTDPKKRRVKKGNETFHRKVGRHECAVQFLRAAGFVDLDDPEGALLSMPVAYIVRLTDAHHCLADAAVQAGLPAPHMPHCPVFNPYSSHSTALDSTRTAKVSQAYKDQAESVAKELKDREAEARRKVVEAAPVALNPSAFWAAAGRRLEEIVRETAHIEEVEKGDASILGGELAGIKAAINGSNVKFESADKKRLEHVVKKRVNEFCILRVTCPDKSVLQVHFRAADRGGHVLSQIGPLLAPHIQAASWYIYQSPPLKKLSERETLFKAGFAPGANLYLGFDGEKPGPPYFEASLQAQLGPPPQDQGRGVNAVAGHLSGEAMGWGQGQQAGAAAAEARATGAKPFVPAPLPGRFGGAGQRLGGAGASAEAAAPDVAAVPDSVPMDVDATA